MKRQQAYNLFNQMITLASEELFHFTLNSNLNIQHKADKSAVTACDQSLDKKLTSIAQNNGFNNI